MQRAQAAGRRDRLIRIDAGTPRAGRSGRPVTDWSTLFDDVWASRGDLTGSESFRASQIQASFDTVFVVPYEAEMDPELVDLPALRRVVCDGRIFDIVGARIVGNRQSVELATKATSRIPEATP